MSKPSDATVTAWARLMRAQQAALSKIEQALKSAGLPPLGWYDALLELERAGNAGLRPLELERQLLLPQYGLSRLLDRIEAAGHITRRPCQDDRRGQVITITKTGKALRRHMWSVYAAAIDEAVGAHLSEAEAASLGRLLGKLVKDRSTA